MKLFQQMLVAAAGLSLIAPIGAQALEMISANVCLKTIEIKLHTAINEYVDKDNQAQGT